ncbi:MAG: 3-isopropylmalate dehydratase small subunit [Candidatus Hinthialibacter antarcticus]|nr:3-isopropylmalate dehydratase small subunit [Candidatus Hinthialibacter antarcticus]
MEPFVKHTGTVAPLDALNVDTDQIIPKQFLKRIERTGYEDMLFYDWRYTADGKPDPDFEMNAERYHGASILLTKDNFGCGSSREHAPWSLHDYGFRCILAVSYADIFFNNCFNNGMLPIVLPSDVIDGLLADVRANEGYQLTVDLPAQKIIKPDGSSISFDVNDFKKHRLLNGLDQIGLTLQHVDKITAYEKQRGIA